MSIVIRKTLSAGAVAVMFAGAPLSAADLEQYRGFRLGSTTATVLALATARSPRDLKVLVERPALIQELEWRPVFDATRDEAASDPVRRVVFTFVDDRLFRILVDYERGRTEGLTRADMIQAFGATYGPHAPPGPRRPGAIDSLEDATPIARWRSDDATVVLQHSEYGGAFSLVVTSTRLAQLAQQARAAGAVLDAREAPARAAAEQKRVAEAAREAAEKTRSNNREAFRP